MGRFSLATFGKKTLPERCIIFAGAYVPSRKDTIRPLFDKWRLVRANWLPYAFAGKQRKNYLILFNIYGASMTLEALHLLKDGGASSVFFIGSMFAKHVPIGTPVIPIGVVDKAGIVLIDDPTRTTVVPANSSVKALKLAFRRLSVHFEEARVVSVPCVLHGVGSVTKFIENSEDIEGVEMEASTFLHFTQKLHMTSYAVLYVSDNKRVDVISPVKKVREARRKALRSITKVALDLL
jgi:purine-nucleoside phosphorylase